MSLRKIWIHGRIEYGVWLSNARMAILLVLLVLIHSLAVQPISDAASEMGVAKNLLEPLAALSNSPLLLLLLPLGFLILIADFPRMGGGFLMQLYRTGRRNWVLGELVELCGAAATYLLAVVAGTLLCSLPGQWYVGAGWSPVATEYAFLYEGSTARTIQSLLPMNLYQQMSVTEAIWRSYLLLFLYLVLSGAVLLFASLLRWKFLGLCLDGALMLSGTGLVMLNADSMWLLPCAHALTWVHYTEYFEQPVVPFWCSVVYFGVGILLFSAGALVLGGCRNFDSILEFD